MNNSFKEITSKRKIKNKILNSHLLSNNENAKIPPAAEINSQSNFDLSSSSSTSIPNKNSNCNNLISKDHSQIELALSNNYKIKNSEFQVISEINSKSQHNSKNVEFIYNGKAQPLNVNGAATSLDNDIILSSNIQSLKSTQNEKNEKSSNEICTSINQLSHNNLNKSNILNSEIKNNNNNFNTSKNISVDSKNSMNNTTVVRNHFKIHSEEDIQKSYSSLNKNNELNFEKRIISDESNKNNNIIDKSVANNSELNSKNYLYQETSSSKIKEDFSKISMNKIKFKNNKLNDMLTSDNKNKDKESIVENIVKPSSSLLNFQNHRAKKMHRNNHEEDNLSTSKDDYNDRYRDLTPNLPIQYSEGESDFDFSESLITNRKRKRCRSIFDIYFDTKRKNSKHSTPSSHSEHKRHKEESLSQNSNHKLSKESENNSHLNDKEKKKSISNQSFANKKNHSNSNDTSSRYYYSSDEDKEKIQESLENSKIKNYKSNKKLKTKKRQPPRSCRTENDPLSAKLYYSMYSSEDNISEIEELFADLDNRQNNIEKEENANYTSGNVKNNNNNNNNYREENTYSSDGKSSIKNKLKDNKLNKNLKYKNSITSLHSISEENIDPKTKLTSNTTTPNKNVKRSKIINNKNFEKEGAEEVEEVEEVEEEEYNKNNKLLHNHNRYSSVSSSLSQRDRDQNRIRVKEDKDNNSSIKKDRYYLGEEKERISKEESFSKQYNQKLKNQKILEQTSNTKSKINTPSRRRKSLIDSKKLHEGSISNSTSTPTKLKSKKYSTHHSRMTTTTTDDSSFLYDDMDSISEMDNNIEGNDKVHRYKRKSLTKINENIISKNDRYDSEVRSRSKDHLDTHNILKSSSTSSNSNDINFMKSSKSRLMTPPNKRSNSKLSTPEKKVRVKMLDLEEKKERHTHHHYSLFGKKLKSKLNSSNSFFDNEFKKSKLKYKSRNEQKEKERKMLSMDKEEEDDDDVEGVEDVEVEEEEEEELYRYPEFLKDKRTIKNNIPKNENKTRNKNRNQRMIKGKDLESESDDIMNETSAYERESIYTPTKPLNCKKIKFIDRERKSHTMNSWNKNPLLIIGSIQNPTLLKRSQPSNSNSNDITNEKSNITNINNGNETSPSNNSSNSNEVDGIKKSQDQTESNSFTEHILLTREVVEQLNSLNVTEDEYDITPTLSKHSNIYIKNELFNLLNDMAANESSYSKAIDNYTTIYSNPIIDKVELAPSRIIEKNKNDNNEKDLENLKDKEEDFAIHYLYFDGESKLDINNNPLLKDTKVSSNNTYLPTPMDSSMEELILTTPIKSGTLEKTKPLFSSSASSVEDSLSEDKISQNTLSSESVKENNIPSDTDFSTFDKKIIHTIIH
ncbi:hypothetical protein LY90DRAFT_518476 [Neocallimastix californiae]|uniref:Uncharacterized protein n=1 Tax=Neocallimastix californiae TaxID=1754190 RepID=A0A1Y1ZMV5_9FUNG|nr:hypothetical protein LY90DRAFT_518476 [Neocallimastix californiae]|eukprot:ORY11566.1 hypothetical protein LY90DRAFT_518476 [Neocallimastix californiae]